jgi:hypothetical protein
MLRKTSSSTAQDEGAALLDKLSVQLGGATPPLPLPKPTNTLFC